MRATKTPALLLALLLSACAGVQENKSETTPEVLYAEAQAEAKDKEYERAQKILDRIRDDFPFSKVAVEAELLGADLAFDQEKFEEATAAYKAFEDLHPTNPRVSYAVFRRGLAQMALSRPEDRDQTATHGAAEAFQRLLHASPDGPYAAEARQKLAVARGRLAAHELYVASFYLRREQPDAARLRLETLLKDYPDTPQRGEAARLLARLEGETSSDSK